MGLALSSDFILGLIVGAVLVLLVQQLTRATSGVGRWLPGIILMIVGALGIVLWLNWLRS
jgi:multisubunit Na+/H+ antiporter MnhE subunit